MEQGRSWLRRMAQLAQQSEEPLHGVPIVELAGESRVLIEGHGGVTQYSREQICVKVRYGLVCVQGSGLELCRMSQEQLVITGRICSVLLRRGR